MTEPVPVIKVLIVPAVTSLLIFLILTFIIAPFWRRYRSRYSQYLPLDAITSRTSSLRERITTRLAGLTLPLAWRRGNEEYFMGSDGAGRESTDTDGEELADVDDETWRIIGRHTQLGQSESTTRLSRDLEEGFRDDSDDENG